MSLLISQVTAGEAFERFRMLWRGQKPHLVGQRALMVAPTVTSDTLRLLILHFNAILAESDVLGTTPGLGQHAKDQYNLPAYDVAAEYATYRAAMVAARDGIQTIYDGSTARSFTAAQVASAVTQLDAVIAALG